MTRTILLLLFTVIIAPILCYYYTTPISDQQVELLWASSKILLGIILACFVVGELSKNYSQTDKLWSIVPIIYAWYITYEAGMNPRMILMSVLVTIWGARLTYNFSRRGGYSWKFWTGEEDYRWAILKARPPFSGKNIPWSLFNLFFISGYQHVLIYMFTLPILAAVKDGSAAIGVWDIALAIGFLFFVVYETIADQQQWNYQNEKHALMKKGDDLSEYYAKGFAHKGLWALSRHPNYFAEQGVWVVFYLFSIVATGEWLNWSVMGCLLLLILFQSSSNFSEEITASKYTEYKEYQKRVPRFMPEFWIKHP